MGSTIEKMDVGNMRKIINEADVFKRRGKILKLEIGEVCKIECLFIKDSGYSNGTCPGKDLKRGFVYTCDMSNLIASNERAQKQLAESLNRALDKKRK